MTTQRPASHGVEERRETTKHCARHGGEEQQLRVEEASDESGHAPPADVAPCWSSARRPQRQRDGQSVGHRVDLHVHGQTVEQRRQRHASGCRKQGGSSEKVFLFFKAEGEASGPTRSSDL